LQTQFARKHREMRETARLPAQRTPLKLLQQPAAPVASLPSRQVLLRCLPHRGLVDEAGRAAPAGALREVFGRLVVAVGN
jgi:hypothetical protein